ncbi:MAG: ParB/RepB/Spo0J family partition protein [Dehalococcoidia bacterium]
MSGPTLLPIDTIRTDGGAQPRDTMLRDTIDEYAELYREGVALPPVVVFHDGADYWLADGYHRVAAAFMAGLDRIAADLRMGTRRDAVLHGCGANATHGIRRSNADKRRAVLRVLEDPEWSRWSVAEIARRCAVSPALVRSVRADLAPAPAGPPPSAAFEDGDEERSGAAARRNGDGVRFQAPAGSPWAADRWEPGGDDSYPVDELDEPDDYRPPPGLPSARDAVAVAAPPTVGARAPSRPLPVVGASTIDRLRSVVTDLAAQTSVDAARALLDDLQSLIDDARALLPPAR